MQSTDPHADNLHITAFLGAEGPFLSVLCKQTFSIDPSRGTLRPKGLAKLSPDLRYRQLPSRIGRAVQQGRDLWPDKDWIDLILDLDAVPAQGRPVTKMQVDVAFEENKASALVFGDRHAYRHQGQLRFSRPEPFTRQPIDDFHAYGGIDPTLMPSDAEQTPMVLGLPVPELFPGAHPMNPAGMGYWTNAENFVDGLMLPNVERCADRLTPERFFAGSSQRWPLTPRPICWGVQSLWSYPRCIYTNRRPYHLPDASDAKAFQALVEIDPDCMPSTDALSVSPRLMQQGARELALSMREGPLALSVIGCFDSGPLRLVVPHEPPPIEIRVASARQTTRAKRLAVHLDGRKHRLDVTWACQCPLKAWVAPNADMQTLMKRHLVVYDGHPLSEQCWSPGRAFLRL